MSDSKYPTITELEALLEKDNDVEILPDGSIHATNERPRSDEDLLFKRPNVPTDY